MTQGRFLTARANVCFMHSHELLTTSGGLSACFLVPWEPSDRRTFLLPDTHKHPASPPSVDKRDAALTYPLRSSQAAKLRGRHPNGHCIRLGHLLGCPPQFRQI